MNDALSVSTYKHFCTMRLSQDQLDLAVSDFFFLDAGLRMRNRSGSLRLVDYNRPFERLIGNGCFRNWQRSAALSMRTCIDAVTAKKLDDSISY